METENKEGNDEKGEIKQQQQLEDKADNFSDQEIEDDFYKIQIENFKNKTTSNFHRNIRLINEKGREIRSAKFNYFRHKKYKEPKEESKQKNENDAIQQRNQGQKLILNNSSGQAENSTTVIENNSAAIQKSGQLGTGSGEEGSGSGGEDQAKKEADKIAIEVEDTLSVSEVDKISRTITGPPPSRSKTSIRTSA